jgi:hypothetical protein
MNVEPKTLGFRGVVVLALESYPSGAAKTGALKGKCSEAQGGSKCLILIAERALDSCAPNPRQRIP